jgi:hypothetical protein
MFRFDEAFDDPRGISFRGGPFAEMVLGCYAIDDVVANTVARLDQLLHWKLEAGEESRIGLPMLCTGMRHVAEPDDDEVLNWGR